MSTPSRAIRKVPLRNRAEKTFTLRRDSPLTDTKSGSGIAGFDEITCGGLPRGRTTLVAGGPGSGKTIFAMQFLAEGARHAKEPGIFVAFEEAPDRLLANFEGFGWKLDKLPKSMLFFLDAQPEPDLIQSGNFDLSGLLAALGAKVKEMGARRIVFDAIDLVIALLPDPASKRREIYRLHQWLLAHELTGLITFKWEGDELHSAGLGFMQFMVDCAVILNHRVETGVSHRSLRVQKYRGSAFDGNEFPFVIGPHGFDVPVSGKPAPMDANARNKRVTSGVKRLDTMLGGGYYRGACVLITGFPGTAKTTLCGSYAEASCKRGERTMFVSFDSEESEVIRNLSSVGIRLDRYVKSGLLRMVSARTVTGSAETILMRIKALAIEHGARNIVIDPVYTLSKTGSELSAHGVAERLIDWTKTAGITLVCTSLLDEMSRQIDGANQISTLADTWIDLNYLVQAGERNRGIAIIKSRGTAHSNQVRELIISDAGVAIADIYTAGGEVLMGTLRWEKEREERSANEMAAVAGRLKRVSIDAEEAVLAVRAKSLQTELLAKKVEKTLLARTAESRLRELSRSKGRIRELRSGDVRPRVRK